MTRAARRIAAAAAIAAACACSSRAARAQNDEQFYFSDDAAMTAGAVVAYPDDPGGLWYNPAALGGVHRTRVSLSGSVIGVRLRPVREALRVGADGGSRALDLDAMNLISTPHSFSLLYGPSDDVTLGFGVYVTDRDVLSAADHAVAAPLGEGDTLTARVDQLENTTKVVFGPAVGFPIARRLRLGFALFGSLFESTRSADAVASVSGVSPGPLVDEQLTTVSLSAWGLSATGGLQWDVTRRVHLGLLLRTPELVLSGGGDVVDTTTTSRGLAPRSVTRATERDAGLGLLAPPHVVLGVTGELSSALRLSLETEIASGAANDALGLDRTAVANARAGLRWRPLGVLALGAGLFTDLASDVRLGPTLGSSRLDYAGGTLGATLFTPVAVADRSAPDALVLTTTIAVRYAVGWGRARTFESDGAAHAPAESDVIFHDVMPYMGSAVLF